MMQEVLCQEKSELKYFFKHDIKLSCIECLSGLLKSRNQVMPKHNSTFRISVYFPKETVKIFRTVHHSEMFQVDNSSFFLIQFLNKSQQNQNNQLILNYLHYFFQISYHGMFKVIAHLQCRQDLISTTIGAAVGDAFQHSDFGIIHAQQTQTAVAQVSHIQFGEVFQET